MGITQEAQDCNSDEVTPETPPLEGPLSPRNPLNTMKHSEASARPPLSTSHSVPAFTSQTALPEEENGEWNSEADLTEVEPMAGLLLSSTHRSPHKVQFAEMAELAPSPRSPSSKNTNKKRWRSRTVSETSTVSCNSISSATSSTTSLPGAPDGGYGWVVVAAAFIVNMIADGVTFSFGVMFDEFQDEFESSKAATAGVVSVFHAVPLLTGPVATWLADRYILVLSEYLGHPAGFLAAALSHNIYLLYLFFGVVAGEEALLPASRSVVPVSVIKKLQNCHLSTCLSGTFLFAPFTQYLMDTYHGWRGACIVLAGVFLNMAVCGMLFRDLPALTRRRKLGRGGSSRSLASTAGTMPEIEQLRIALQSGEVNFFVKEETEEPRLASSLITIPTYIKNASRLPDEVLALLASNHHHYDYVEDNFPESLILGKSLEDELKKKVEKEQLKQKTGKDKEEKENIESTGIKLKRRVSSMIRTKSILKKKQEDPVKPPHNSPPLEQPLLEPLPEVTMRASQEQRVQRLHHLRVRRQSLTYRGACLSTARYQMRASSCPDIYRNSVGDLHEVEGDCWAEWRHSLRQCCALKYITLAFSIFCFSNFILYFWYDVPYVYTIGYAENRLRISTSESTMILSVIGILNTLGEVIVGWVADLPWVNSNLLYACCMLVCGLVTAVIPLVSSYALILVLSGIYGLCISANYSLTSPILVDLVSLDQFSSAYGFLLACQGVGNLIGPPVAGWLYDFTGDWQLTFALAGLFIAVSGVLLLLLGTLTWARRWCGQGGQQVTV